MSSQSDPDWQTVMSVGAYVSIILDGQAHACLVLAIDGRLLTVQIPQENGQAVHPIVGSTAYIVADAGHARTSAVYGRVMPTRGSEAHVARALTLALPDAAIAEWRQDVRVTVALKPLRLAAYMPSWTRVATLNDTSSTSTTIDQVACAGLIVNLSAGGCLLDCTLPLPRDVTLDVVLALTIPQSERLSLIRPSPGRSPQAHPAPRTNGLIGVEVVGDPHRRTVSLPLVAITVRPARLHDHPLFSYQVRCRFAKMPDAYRRVLTAFVFDTQLRQKHRQNATG